MLKVFNRSEKARRSPSRSIALVGALLTSFGVLALGSTASAAVLSLDDFEAYAQGAADGSWGSNAAFADDGDNYFQYNGDGGGIYAGIHAIAADSANAYEGQSCTTQALVISWNAAAGYAGAGKQFPAVDLSSYDGIRFWTKGSSARNGTFEFKLGSGGDDIGTGAESEGSEWTLREYLFTDFITYDYADSFGITFL